VFLRKKLLALFLFVPMAAVLFAQEETNGIPAELIRPRHGEAPRFPRDYWVGELGRGDAGEEAYQAARRFLTRFMQGNFDEAPERAQEPLAALRTLEARAVHVGAGQKESGGIVSFLFRFLGREAAITGEIYLRPASASWRIDDIMLDKERPLSEGRYSPNWADLTPYERFF
jgi:hypothetical protein